MVRTEINGISWTSESKYVDVETGEQLTEKEGKSKNYIIIKTKKHATLNNNKTKGHIEYTRECRRNPQRKLFAD